MIPEPRIIQLPGGGDCSTNMEGDITGNFNQALLLAAEAVRRAYVESLPPGPERDAQLHQIHFAKDRESALASAQRAIDAMDEHDRREDPESAAIDMETGRAIFLAVRECRAFVSRYPDDDAVPNVLSRILTWMAD